MIVPRGEPRARGASSRRSGKPPRDEARLRGREAELLDPELRSPRLDPLMEFGPNKLSVATYQAISGAGKTFAVKWPEMVDNVIPFIKGEEEKSEQEPLKIWGRILDGDRIVLARAPVVSAQCIRVPVSDGDMAAVSVSFDRKPSREEILAAWREFSGKPQKLGLPSAPKPFLTYYEDDARPQTKLDRDLGNGMAVTIGRLRHGRDLRLPLRRALAQHGARSRGRRDPHRAVPHGRGVHRSEVGSGCSNLLHRPKVGGSRNHSRIVKNRNQYGLYVGQKSQIAHLDHAVRTRSLYHFVTSRRTLSLAPTEEDARP